MVGYAQQPGTNSAPSPSSIIPAISPAATNNVTAAAPPTLPGKLKEALDLLVGGQIDQALASVNQALAMDQKSLRGYLIRGEIYTIKEQWDLAQKDYETAGQIDPRDVVVKFNLADLKFRKKEYDPAREAFVAIENDPDYGDLSSYKVFLCDLQAGREDVANKELSAFEEAASKPSYFFSHVAWSAAHHKTEDARGWLDSALKIYSATKINLYATTLKNLGYLPLPPAAGAQ